MKRSSVEVVGLGVFACVVVACTQLPASRLDQGDAASSGTCRDGDGDGYGLGCDQGPDCDDSDPNLTTQCSDACRGRAEQGCPCGSEGATQSCFLADKQVAQDQVMCTEGTRTCRAGVWSGCEQTHQYIKQVQPETGAVIDPNAANPTCSICDILCFKAIDNLSVDGGTADGSVTFGPSGGLTLEPTDAGTADGGSANSCLALSECCYDLVDPLHSACATTAVAGVDANCATALDTYCPNGAISGPLSGCVLGSPPDSDCDGIPDVVDATNGPPISGNNIQTIFHELNQGQSGSNTLDISYTLRNADVYVLFDSTGTMGPERQNLTNLLTTGNVVYCAELNQCCGSNSTCASIVSAGDATNCYSAQPTYCGNHIDCADTDGDGAPNNELATQGVVGGVRCLIGNSWFGLGQFREIPAHSEPEQIPCLAEGCRYGDRDEQIFRQMVDMTSDLTRFSTALASISMNYNWDEPEGGYMALNSLATGHGHYFGINRPAVPDRSHGEGCGPNTFGYACFRNDAVPIVVMLTDAAHHNGPSSSTLDPGNCYSRGAGCPYSALTTSNMYTSSSADSASDGVAHFIPASSEDGSSAVDLGDVRGQYLTAVGDTTYMKADFTGSQIGCSATDSSPDAVIKFEVGQGTAIDVNFHLTKNDAYPDNYYGQWSPWALTAGTDDPTPGTEFGAVVSVFKDDPSMSSNALHCVSDPQPSPLRGSNWQDRKVDFTVNLAGGKTYYVVIKGTSTSSLGRYQLQVGQTSAMIKTTYSPPLWTATRDALVAAGIRVLPVLATGGYSSNFVATAEMQAQILAQATGAVRSDGTPIWYRIQNDGSQTGQALVNSIADLSQNLAMNVTVSDVDGPDPGASLFPMTVVPLNSPGCLQPHPLVGSDGTCSGTTPGFDCNTQYQCRPGATPKFGITFTNPASAPVPPNPNDPYGGYLFKLQLKSNNQYLLTEIPVYLIPTTVPQPPAPTQYQSTGTYQQDITATSCTTSGSAGDASTSNTLPTWGDLYFDAQLPAGTSIDFQLCTADTASGLDACDWSTRPSVTVSASGSCSSDADCANVAGYGRGQCTSSGICQFITPAKIWPGVTCNSDSVCPNGPLGAGSYVIESYCQTTSGQPYYAQCIGISEPLDMGATLASGEDGRLFARVNVTLHSDPLMLSTPQLSDWYLTYTCNTAL